MKYLARTVEGRPLLGDEDGYVPLSAAAPDLESVREALPRAASGSLPDVDSASAERIDPNHVRFGPPLARFGKLWGIGLNYAEHAGDLDEDRPDEPASFMKPASALVGPGGPIRLPPTEQTERVTAEAELGVVIGRQCRGIEADTDADADEDALADAAANTVDDVIAGYLPVIDMTAEDILQRNPRFLTRAKSFDSFLVVGPAIAVPEADDSLVLADLTVETIVNDRVAAENEVRNMLFPPRELVSFHADVMTLSPGDLFSTGTPGAAPIEPGDEVRAAVERIGSVEAPVVR